LPIAYAEEIIKNDANKKKGIQVKIVDKKEIEPKFSKAILKALGRPQKTAKYAYIIGTSDNIPKAIIAAEDIKLGFAQTEPKIAKNIEVIKFEKNPTCFVLIGGFSQYKEAVDIQNKTQAAMLKSLKTKSDPHIAKYASLILGGKVVSRTALYSKIASKNREE
jgi:hypothetical protein